MVGLACVWLMPFVEMPGSPLPLQKEYPWVLEYFYKGKWNEVEMFRLQKEAEKQAERWRTICGDEQFRVVGH